MGLVYIQLVLSQGMFFSFSLFFPQKQIGYGLDLFLYSSQCLVSFIFIKLGMTPDSYPTDDMPGAGNLALWL